MPSRWPEIVDPEGNDSALIDDVLAYLGNENGLFN
jgi:hypothetical protein